LQGSKIGSSWFLPGAICFPGVWRLSRGLKTQKKAHLGLIPDGLSIGGIHEKELLPILHPAPRPPAKAGEGGGWGCGVGVALAAA